jgi:hypothetical protein
MLPYGFGTVISGEPQPALCRAEAIEKNPDMINEGILLVPIVAFTVPSSSLCQDQIWLRELLFWYAQLSSIRFIRRNIDSDGTLPAGHDSGI